MKIVFVVHIMKGEKIVEDLKSVENVNLATIISYSDEQGKHHFLDTYDKGE